MPFRAAGWVESVAGEAGLMTPDIQKLISEIAIKNHILLDIDDPVFKVVTANRQMLNEAVEVLETDCPLMGAGSRG
jgi:hypothetical protein